MLHLGERNSFGHQEVKNIEFISKVSQIYILLKTEA